MKPINSFQKFFLACFIFALLESLQGFDFSRLSTDIAETDLPQFNDLLQGFQDAAESQNWNKVVKHLTRDPRPTVTIRYKENGEPVTKTCPTENLPVDSKHGEPVTKTCPTENLPVDSKHGERVTRTCPRENSKVKSSQYYKPPQGRRNPVLHSSVQEYDIINFSDMLGKINKDEKVRMSVDKMRLEWISKERGSAAFFFEGWFTKTCQDTGQTTQESYGASLLLSKNKELWNIELFQVNMEEAAQA